MSRLIFFNMMTVDGLFEGPGSDISWHNVDDEFNVFAIEQLESADALIFGRVTYELMAGYWPGSGALEDDPVVAGKMNSIPKIVFSKTLSRAGWENTRLEKGDPAEAIKKLKKEFRKDIYIFGSAELGSSLSKNNLIDEYRILINPLILGKGIPLFKQGNEQIKLKLLKIREFKSGNILLCYEPHR